MFPIDSINQNYERITSILRFLHHTFVLLVVSFTILRHSHAVVVCYYDVIFARDVVMQILRKFVNAPETQGYSQKTHLNFIISHDYQKNFWNFTIGFFKTHNSNTGDSSTFAYTFHASKICIIVARARAKKKYIFLTPCLYRLHLKINQGNEIA